SYELKEGTHDKLIDGRTASIIVNGKSIGYLGELHPETLRDWNIKMPSAVLELDLGEVFKAL
ncbi:MAG: phenylalanine--tRNA ligase subunit beta, partial [Nanoarchaeota archaeon]|nr:phenylalanine--tRNA ligase subunit beta [Nanoarchaeota archaeon]